MPAMFRRRPPPLGAALVLLLSVAFLSLLFLPAKDEANLRLVLAWRPETEPLLLMAGLAALALAGRSLRPAWRWLLALLLFVAALLQFAVAAMLGIFDRDLNLYIDLRYVPSVLGLFWAAAGPRRGGPAVPAGRPGAAAVAAAIALVPGLAPRAPPPPRPAAARPPR